MANIFNQLDKVISITHTDILSGEKKKTKKKHVFASLPSVNTPYIAVLPKICLVVGIILM